MPTTSTISMHPAGHLFERNRNVHKNLPFDAETLIREAHMKAYDFSEEEVAAMPVVSDDALTQYMTLEELDERLDQSIKKHLDARFCQV